MARLQAGFCLHHPGKSLSVESYDSNSSRSLKVQHAMRALTTLENLHHEISSICNDAIVNKVLISRQPVPQDDAISGNSDKSELQKQLITTTDRLMMAAEHMMALREKLALLLAENLYLRKRLQQQTEAGSRTSVVSYSYKRLKGQ